METTTSQTNSFPVKSCLVCGDRALGYNFNAVSCESCKAFFRRNALASKEFKCPFTNTCEITVVTRRFCQKCRLEKCLSVGMVKEFIMSEEDKAEKRKKIEENRAKKRTRKDGSDETVSSSKCFKREDETQTNLSQPGPEPSSIQYNVLNSTTCSPTLQSPIQDFDSNTQTSIQNQYADPNEYSNYRQGYVPKKYIDMDSKSVYPSLISDYGVTDSMDAMYDSGTDKSVSSIRYVFCVFFYLPN